MKHVLKNILAITLTLSVSSFINADMIKNNRTAYDLTARAAHLYLNYHHTKGASATQCSSKGKPICTLLQTLKEKTRLFYQPERPDLQQLSFNAATAFRDYDLSGTNNDRIVFANTLVSLLQALLPLLTEKESECRSLIEQIRETIQ